ncbi:MAG: putative quinol monooxygenase [Pseudomonadota bacterium]
MSYAVVVRFHIGPEAWEEFVALVKNNAHLSLQEPGCVQFDVLTDPARLGEVFLYEIYTDRAAFDAHLATAHFVDFDAAYRDMVSEKQVETWKEVRQ